MVRSRVLVALALAMTVACGTFLQIDPDESSLPAREGGAKDARADGEVDVAPCETGPSGDCIGSILATGRGRVDALVVDGAFLYYASRSGKVGRVGVTGEGAREYGTTFVNAVGIAVDATHVYVASYTQAPGIARVAKDGDGTIETVDPCDGASGVAVYGGSAFWLTTGCGRPHAGAKNLATGSSIASDADVDTTSGFAMATRDGHIAVDDAGVFFASYAKVGNLPLDLAGTPRILSNWQTSPEGVLGLSIDEDGVYVRTSGEVSMLSKAQKSPDIINALFSAPTLPREEDRSGITTDANYIYFASSGGHELRRVAKSGGKIELVAADPGGPLAVALSGPYVYWSNGYGELLRAPKPP